MQSILLDQIDTAATIYYSTKFLEKQDDDYYLNTLVNYSLRLSRSG